MGLVVGRCRNALHFLELWRFEHRLETAHDLKIVPEAWLHDDIADAVLVDTRRDFFFRHQFLFDTEFAANRHTQQHLVCAQHTQIAPVFARTHVEHESTIAVTREQHHTVARRLAGDKIDRLGIPLHVIHRAQQHSVCHRGRKQHTGDQHADVRTQAIECQHGSKDHGDQDKDTVPRLFQVDRRKEQVADGEPQSPEQQIGLGQSRRAPVPGQDERCSAHNGCHGGRPANLAWNLPHVPDPARQRRTGDSGIGNAGHGLHVGLAKLEREHQQRDQAHDGQQGDDVNMPILQDRPASVAQQNHGKDRCQERCADLGVHRQHQQQGCEVEHGRSSCAPIGCQGHSAPHQKGKCRDLQHHLPPPEGDFWCSQQDKSEQQGHCRPQPEQPKTVATDAERDIVQEHGEQGCLV